MMTKRKKSTLDRFWEKVQRTPTCWLWTGGTAKARGSRWPPYGHFWFENKVQYAHRASYQMFRGAIPAGQTVDHLCREPTCVKPDHLEVVSLSDNILRGRGFAALNRAKTHCLNDHPFDLFNTRITKEGHRICRRCHLEETWRRRGKGG